MSQSTDLVIQKAQEGGLSAFLDQGANPFTELAGEYGVPTGDILVFSGNTGQFSYKGTEIPPGTAFIFNVMGMEKGWICWKDKKPVGRELVKVIDRIPAKRESELDDHGPYTREGDGWSECMSVKVCDLQGEHPELELCLSSRSGVSALSRLANDFGQKVRLYKDEAGNYKMPVVEVSSNGFESKKAVGKKYAPVFKIVDWISVAEMDEIKREAINNGAEQEEQAPPESTQAPPATQTQQTQAQPAAAATQAPPAGFRGGRAGKRI